MCKSLWAISILGAMLAALNYILSTPSNALQQAALAGMTLVYVILPYCLARSASEYLRIGSEEKKEIVQEPEMDESKLNIQGKLSDAFISAYELQKLDLLYKVTHFNSESDITYELVSEKITFLKLLSEKGIISNDKFENLKTKLLTLLKDNLNAKLKSDEMINRSPIPTNLTNDLTSHKLQK